MMTMTWQSYAAVVWPSKAKVLWVLPSVGFVIQHGQGVCSSITTFVPFKVSCGGPFEPGGFFSVAEYHAMA